MSIFSTILSSLQSKGLFGGGAPQGQTQGAIANPSAPLNAQNNPIIMPAGYQGAPAAQPGNAGLFGHIFSGLTSQMPQGQQPQMPQQQGMQQFGTPASIMQLLSQSMRNKLK